MTFITQCQCHLSNVIIKHLHTWINANCQDNNEGHYYHPHPHPHPHLISSKNLRPAYNSTSQLSTWHLNSSPGWQHSRKHNSQIHKDAKASKWRCENLRLSQETKRHKMKKSMGPQLGKKTKRLVTHSLQNKWAEKRMAMATLFKHNFRNLPCRKRNQTGEMGGMGGERGKCLVALLLLLQTYSFSTLEKYI